MKKIAIIQPNFFPWVGYYEIIKTVDAFVLLDDVKYTKRDWRNRNLINLNNKPSLFTIPVITKNKFNQKLMKS